MPISKLRFRSLLNRKGEMGKLSCSPRLLLSAQSSLLLSSLLQALSANAFLTKNLPLHSAPPSAGGSAKSARECGTINFCKIPGKHSLHIKSSDSAPSVIRGKNIDACCSEDEDAATVVRTNPHQMSGIFRYAGFKRVLPSHVNCAASGERMWKSYGNHATYFRIT
ncbi:hypothetical protein J6590_020818 [Homalodisca vitripennis]|nr:hypothetical protein J6590_020818 [Homalodisca vitripennis]